MKLMHLLHILMLGMLKLQCGPSTVDVTYNFINLFENEFKPNVENFKETVEVLRS
jgi:hypothetical protein